MRMRTVFQWNLLFLCFIVSQSTSAQIFVRDSSVLVCTTLSDTARYLLINPADSGDTVTLEIIDLPDTITINDFKDTLAVGDSTELILSEFSGVENGSYTFFIRVTQDTVVNDVLVVIEVNSSPDEPGLTFPEQGREDINLVNTFTWVPDGQPKYRFQLATDSLFNTIIIRLATMSILSIQKLSHQRQA